VYRRLTLVRGSSAFLHFELGFGVFAAPFIKRWIQNK